MPKDPPQFDASSVELPSDRITMGQMRRLEPGVFTADAIAKGMDFDGMAVLYLEQKLARKAFARALGMVDPDPQLKRPEIIEALDEAYATYGISSGLQQTRQLARDIETAAVNQAESVRGSSR